MKPFVFLIILLPFGNNILFSQNYTEILGRPTDHTVTMNILFDQQEDVYWEYGTVSGVYTETTNNYKAIKDIPLEVDFTNLQPNTEYYYRTRYRDYGSATVYSAGKENTFYTQRKPGTTFTFAIEADPHLDSNSNPASYTLTLQNIFSKKPDFLIDLGDIFMSEKLPVINQTNITNRHILYRPYFNIVSNSIPLYLVIGNHEGELGWLLDGTANSLPVMASNTRNLYYPNPIPNTFYTGDTISEQFVGLRGNYYAWEWGDALFVVLDPYWYTKTKPDWGWTLGVDQYNWFKNVLTTSNAKFKFVFCHQIVGGSGTDGRGGIEFADFFEMGGENHDSTWGFDMYRSGWGKPVHNLMKDNNVNIFFHGHDHFYDKQDKDGIVYLEVPQPSSKNINNTQATQYGYVNGTILPSRGYILVTVSDNSTKVDYIRTYLPSEENATRKNADVATSFTINSTSVQENNDVYSFDIKQNFPNPFNQTTSINYQISKANNVQLKVFDIFGQEITTLVNKYQSPGNYTLTLNPRELFKSDGIYYYKIIVGKYSKSMKMIYYK